MTLTGATGLIGSRLAVPCRIRAREIDRPLARWLARARERDRGRRGPSDQGSHGTPWANPRPSTR